MTYNFWDGGHFVYFLCIFLVSNVLLKRTNNHNFFGTLLLFLSATSFFWVFWIECKYLKDSDVYDIWNSWISSPTAWLGSLIVLLSVWTIDPIILTIFEKACLCCCRQRTKTACSGPSEIEMSTNRNLNF